MDLFKNTVITKVDWVIIGVSIFLLIMISLAYFFVAGILNEQIKQAEEQVIEAQAKLSETRAIAAKKDGLLEDLREVRARIATFEGKLPTEKELPRLLNQFQKNAEHSGVKYRSITAEPIDEQELYVRVPFKVKVEGAYGEVGEFLKSLEFGDRFIKVENIEIGPEEKGRSKASFIISTYMFISQDVQSQSGETQS